MSGSLDHISHRPWLKHRHKLYFYSLQAHLNGLILAMAKLATYTCIQLQIKGKANTAHDNISSDHLDALSVQCTLLLHENKLALFPKSADLFWAAGNRANWICMFLHCLTLPESI